MAKITGKQLIALYKKQKKALKRTNQTISRAEFLNHNKEATKTIIDNEFGSYTKFVNQAEDAFREALPAAEKALLSERSKKFDAEVTKEQCIADLRSLQEAEPEKFITRNYYRIHGTFSDGTWDRYFGTFAEFKKQAGLELSRQQQHLEKGVAKHASVDHYRKFFDEQVLPYYKKYPKPDRPDKIKTIMVGSDIHDEECNEFVLEMFIYTCKIKQPDVIVLNGDIFDCYEFSKYSQDPRHVKLKERFKFVHERIFAPLRAACPDAQIDFILGNHEIRILKIIADQTPALRVLLSDVMGLTFADVFGVDKYQINIVSKLDLGAFTKTDMNNEMKQNYQVYYGCYGVCHEPDERIRRSISGTNGHHHSASMVSDANLTFGSITWVQTPAMHVRDAEYLKNFCAWNMGFLEVIINVDIKQVIQKVHTVHEDWTVIDGVYYERKN